MILQEKKKDRKAYTERNLQKPKALLVGNISTLLSSK